MGVLRFCMGVFQKPFKLRKDFWPNLVVQKCHLTYAGALILSAPKRALQAHQIGDGAALHDFEIGIIIVIVGDKTPVAVSFQYVAALDELSIVGRQLQPTFLEDRRISDDTVQFAAHRQPSDCAVGKTVVFEVNGIEGAGQICLTQVKYLVVNRRRVIERESPASYDIRQRTPLIEIGIEINVVVTHNKIKIQFRKRLPQQLGQPATEREIP